MVPRTRTIEQTMPLPPCTAGRFGWRQWHRRFIEAARDDHRRGQRRSGITAGMCDHLGCWCWRWTSMGLTIHYENVVYHECVSVGWNTAWCCTYHGWGSCAASCPLSPQACATDGIAGAGAVQTYLSPFTYDGNVYHEGTLVGLKHGIVWYFVRMRHLGGVVPDVAGLCIQW